MSQRIRLSAARVRSGGSLEDDGNDEFVLEEIAETRRTLSASRSWARTTLSSCANNLTVSVANSEPVILSILVRCKVGLVGAGSMTTARDLELYDLVRYLRMQTPARGTSTPSRRRSKWDEDDPDAEETQRRQQSLKRRIKLARSERPRDASQMPVDPSPSQRSRPSHPSAHSAFVPLRNSHPPIRPSRSVYSYERLNQIEEGSYGIVFRARDKETGDIVALKKLKLDEEKHGFPITALREISALMACQHENVVRIREVVVGDTLTQ